MVRTHAPLKLPTFSPAERAGLLDFWSVWDANYPEIQAAAAAKLREHPEVAEALRSGPASEIEKSGFVTRERLRRGMVDGKVEAYAAELRESGRRLAKAGVDLATWIDITAAVRSAAVPLVMKAYSSAPDRLGACLQALNRWTDLAFAVLSDEFVAAKEDLIAEQSEAILQLSTPVLEIRQGRLVIPIIGLVDASRAAQISERMLEAVRDYRATVVILDITGVTGVDTAVANHLLRAAQAARLMGAEVIVTGISAQVASTLVALGVELEGVGTFAALRTGNEAADRLQHTRFVRDE